MKKTVTTWYCDRCQEEGDHYNTVGHKKIRFLVFGAFSDREICKECYEEFMDWFMERKPAPTTDKEE